MKCRNQTCVAAMLAVLGLIGASGCVASEQFRTAALPQLQSGASSILNGVLDGFFAAIEVESD